MLGFLIQLDLEYNKNHIAEFECGTLVKTKVTVNGTVLGNVTLPAKEKEKSKEVRMNIEVKTAGSEQMFTHAEGSEEIDHLESSTGGAFESSTEEVIEAHVHFANAGVEAEFHC